MMDVLNEQTKHNPLAVALMGEVTQGRAAEDQITQSLHLLSRWIEGYRDPAPAPNSFQAWVEAGLAPEEASIESRS